MVVCQRSILNLQEEGDARRCLLLLLRLSQFHFSPLPPPPPPPQLLFSFFRLHLPHHQLLLACTAPLICYFPTFMLTLSLPLFVPPCTLNSCGPGLKVSGSDCEGCPLNTYKEVSGNEECTNCSTTVDENSGTLGQASVSPAACVCNAGHTGPDGGLCTPCPADRLVQGSDWLCGMLHLP